MSTKKNKKAQNQPPKPPAGQIPPRKDWETEWDRLKHSVSGNKGPGLSEEEKFLLTNDSESLKLDPVDQTYPATQLVGAIVPQNPSTRGAMYLNATMTSMYRDDEPATSLIEAGAKEPVESKKELAKFCLMMSHLERCYAEKKQHRDPE
jgi:hypothetical protein